MLGNITNLIQNAYTILSLIMQLWKYLIAIGVPVGVVIVVRYFTYVFRDVELIYHGNNEISCRYPNNPKWQQHLFARGILWLFTPWRKYKKANKCSENILDITNREIFSRVNKTKKDITITDVDTREFIESENTITRAIEDTISKDLKGDLQTAKLKIKKYSEGRCELRCGGRLVAYSYSYEKLKLLEDSLREIIEDNKVKKSIAESHTNFKKKSDLERLFKIKLAKFVNIVQTLDSIIPFR